MNKYYKYVIRASGKAKTNSLLSKKREKNLFHTDSSKPLYLRFPKNGSFFKYVFLIILQEIIVINPLPI